jgi:hypothetical protein
MKNFLKIALVATLLLTASGTYATDVNFSLTAKSENEKSIVFSINESQNITVSITGADEGILYQQNIHAAGGSKKTYDLAAFPDGKYTFKLETETTITAYQIAIENGKALVSEPMVMEIFKPVLTKENELITLSLDNILKDEVEVKILNEYNEELYKKVFAGKSKVVKNFNIEKTDAKELTFVVKSKDKEFIKTVELR